MYQTFTFEQILFDLLLGLKECIRIEFTDKSELDRFLQVLAKKEEYSKIMDFVENNGLNLNNKGRFRVKLQPDYLHIKDNEFIRVEDI